MRIAVLLIAACAPASFAGTISPDLQQQLPQLGLLSSSNVIVQLNVPLTSPLVNTAKRGNVVWGSSNPIASSNVVWGSNVVWAGGQAAAESASAAIYGEN
jgi:hypothetical protein